MDKKYIVTYDLNKAGQDYNTLIKAIGTFPNVHPMKSVWFIKSNSTAGEIAEYLRTFMDSNDSLFVGEIINNRQGIMPKSAWEFLNS